MPIDHTHTHTDSHPAHLTATEARSAVKHTGLRKMLYISLALVVIAMIALWAWSTTLT